MGKNEKEYEVEALIGKRRKKNSGNFYVYIRICWISCPLERLSQRAINMGARITFGKCAIHDWWVQQENPREEHNSPEKISANHSTDYQTYKKDWIRTSSFRTGNKEKIGSSKTSKTCHKRFRLRI